MPLILALRGQRQADPCESQTSLGYPLRLSQKNKKVIMPRTGEEEPNGSLRCPCAQMSAEASKARAAGSYRAGETGVSCRCRLGTSLDTLPRAVQGRREYLCDT